MHRDIAVYNGDVFSDETAPAEVTEQTDDLIPREDGPQPVAYRLASHEEAGLNGQQTSIYLISPLFRLYLKPIATRR